MNKMKLNIKTTFLKVNLMLMLFIGLTANTYGQDHGVYQVKFDFYHSLRIPNHHVFGEGYKKTYRKIDNILFNTIL